MNTTPQATPAAIIAPHSGLKVLIVDDYGEHVESLAATFKMYECEVRGTCLTAEGMALAEDWNPHLILWDDYQDGGHLRAWQFAAWLSDQRRKLPYHLQATSRPPYMIAMTGIATILQRRLCEEFGFDEYHAKPFTVPQIVSWIQKARERHQAFK